MIPNDSLSSLLLPAMWLAPDDLENSYLVDYELGGIGLDDPSQGLKVQTWTLKLVGSDVIISAENWPETILFTRIGITELSLAFDQNMKPFVAFVENDVAKFWWFDTFVGTVVFSTLPAGSRTPRCCLDDKRELQTGTSDIILCYALNGILCRRQQRDRFTIEVQLGALHNTDDGIRRVGMHEKNRLQFMIQGPLPEGYVG